MQSKSNDKCKCESCAKQLAGTVTTEWADSKAKKHLRLCLEGDEEHSYWTMQPLDLYQSNKLLFHQYKYSNFRTNLNTLKKSISVDNGQIKFDELAIKLESMTFTREEVTKHGNPYYDTSKARESLVRDVDDGTAAKYKNKPRELRATKPEYQCFRPYVFTKHYNRETRRQKEEVGWQHRRNLKGSRTNLTKHDRLQTVEAESAGVSESPPSNVGR